MNTRHNIGFEVLGLFAKTLGVKIKKRKFGGCFGEVFFEDKKLILLKPQSFMNRSGQVVATAFGFYKLELADLLVVTDDMALAAILSSQLVYSQFVANFKMPPPIGADDNVKICRGHGVAQNQGG